MGRRYSITFENATAATASGDIDLFSILPAANRPVQIISIKLDQLQEKGDAQEGYGRLKIIRGHTTAPSGGNSVTAAPLDTNDVAAGATVRTMDPTIASAGTAVDLGAFGWNVRGPFREVFAPEERPRGQNANWIVVRLMAALPGTDPEISGTLIFEEM